MTGHVRAEDGRLTLRLPGLVAGRDLARQMVERLADSYAGRVVVIDARRTSEGSASFASELVQLVLVVGDARTLVVVGAPERFRQHFQDAADRSGVSARLHVTVSLPADEYGVEETGART